MCAGSGDDMFYAQQVSDYINQQKKFWLLAVEIFSEAGIQEGIKIAHSKLHIDSCENCQMTEEQAKNGLQKIKKEIRRVTAEEIFMEIDNCVGSSELVDEQIQELRKKWVK